MTDDQPRAPIITQIGADTSLCGNYIHLKRLPDAMRYHAYHSWVAQILIRQIDDDTKGKLQRLARQHGRSTEEEVREILRNAVREVDEPPAKLGSRIAARFSGVGLKHEVAELRGQPVQPAQFDS